MHRREDVVLVRLDDAAVHDHLVEDEVGLLKVEHDVQLTLRRERAHVSEVRLRFLQKAHS